MVEIINALVGGVEKLLNVVNSKRRLLFLACLTLLAICTLLAYQLVLSQEVISEFTSPRIERVSGWCYQQRIRRDRRIVAIQFPIPDLLIPKGITQSLVAFVFTKPINQLQFDELCNSLINEVFDPQPKLKLLRSNPEWKVRLQDFYRNLDSPIAQEPIKKSEVKAPK